MKRPMLHEKSSELFAWRDKVAGLEHLPGEAPLDKSKAWNKLNYRLEKEPAAKTRHWYWLAAASLVLVIGTGWFMMTKDDNQVVKKDPPQWLPRPLSPGRLPIEPGKPNQPIQNKPQLTTATSISKVQPKALMTRTPTKDSTETKQLQPVNLPVPEQLNQMVSTDSIQLPPSLAVRKKLRVVHINTLEGPAEKQAASANSAIAYYTDLRKQPIFTNIGLSNNASDNIIKIKLSPSN